MSDTKTCQDQFYYGSDIKVSVHIGFVKLEIINDDVEHDIYLANITIEQLMAALGEGMARRMRLDAVYIEHS
jgi:hypothetical protein